LLLPARLQPLASMKTPDETAPAVYAASKSAPFASQAYPSKRWGCVGINIASFARPGCVGINIASFPDTITVVLGSTGWACSLCFVAFNDSGGGTNANDCRVRALSADANMIRVKWFFFIGAHSTADLRALRLKNRSFDVITLSFFVVSVPCRRDLLRLQRFYDLTQRQQRLLCFQILPKRNYDVCWMD
jgi:hypothetical protein